MVGIRLVGMKSSDRRWLSQLPGWCRSGRDQRASRGFQYARFELLEPRYVLNSDLVVSEILAKNVDGHLDSFKEDSDWFEIHNGGSSQMFLNGWHATDDLADLAKWSFPMGTTIGPDERMVIFASENDLVTPTGEMHTNFRLDSDGEPLVLVQPDGTVVSGFGGVFPPQTTNVSYGIDESQTITALVGGATGTVARALVPVDNSLGDSWTGAAEPFDDSPWISGSSGMGYENVVEGDVLAPPVAYWTFDELTHAGTAALDERGNYDAAVVGATLTSGGQGRFGEAIEFDGNNDYVNVGVVSEMVDPTSFAISLWFKRAVDHSGTEAETNHAVNNVLIAHSSPTWNDTLEIGTEQDYIEVYLDTNELGGSIPPIRQQAAVQNDLWHHLVLSYDSSDVLETTIYLDGVLVSALSDYGGALSDSELAPLTIGLSRPGDSSTGDFEGWIDDVAIWDAGLNAAQVQSLYSGDSPSLLSGYLPQIDINLGTPMWSQNSTAFLRLPFSVSDPLTVDRLRLEVQYDDGFVAYVNGQEIARSNFTGVPEWNSSADTDRPDIAALQPEEYWIDLEPGLLRSGENVLAIQGLNASATAARSLLVPVLDAVQVFYQDVVLLGEGASGVAWVPTDDAVGETWRGSVPFDDSGWLAGESGVGYDLTPHDVALTPMEIASVLGGPAPLAYWTFDELLTGGTVVPDLQGNYQGAVVGATVTSGQQGRFGEALSFDGEDDYVSAGMVTELVNPASFSLAVWFKRSDDHSGTVDSTNHSVNNVLFAHSSDTSNDTFEIGTEFGFVELYLDTAEHGGNIPPERVEAAIENDTWHHLVMTYDSQTAEETKIYLDGVLVQSFSEYGGLLSESGDSPLTIGVSRPTTASTGDFDGMIDDLAIWDAALSAEQVAAMYPVPGPLAYWTFDAWSAEAGVIADQQGNYHGEVSGATLTTGSQGRFGEALSFANNDDFMSAGVVAELINPSAFSASVWFQRSVDHVGTESATNHAVNNVLLAHSSNWANDTFEIGTEGEFIEIYLDTEELGGSILPIRQPAGIQNGIWHHLVFTYDSLESEEAKIYLDGSLVHATSDYGGLISESDMAPLSFGVARPDGVSAGHFEGLLDDVAIWDAALTNQQVTILFEETSPLIATGTGYLPHIGMNMKGIMEAEDSSVYLRMPFTVEDPTAILSLDLALKYNHGFVAYINGTEIARDNVSGNPAWNSVADAVRPDRSGFESEHFGIGNSPQLLEVGVNVLAIQGMSVEADAERFLVLPELSATMQSGQQFSFMETPTPGAVNEVGMIGFVPVPELSVPAGTFVDDFVLYLDSEMPGSELRYTTDRSVPTESSTLYNGPIEIDKTTQIRVKGFRSGYISSEVVGATYVPLGSDVLDVSSDLPIVLLENYNQREPSTKQFHKGFISIFEPDSTGRSRLTDMPDLTSRIGMHRRGSSTFGNPKTNWRIEFRDQRDEDRSLSPVGLPANADWILYAPYEFDRALLRNVFVYELSRRMGRWAPRTQFVEVYANTDGDEVELGDYSGVYVLMERIEIDEDRVDIQKMTALDNEEPDVSGGYIFKVDRSGEPGDEFFSSRGNNYIYYEPDVADITSQQRTYLRNFLSDFEAKLYGADFQDPVLGYKAMCDVGSFVDEHILRFLTNDPDAFVLSSYLHKDRNGLLKYTPVWDFDRTIGSDTDFRSANPREFGDLFGRRWFGRLFSDPDFSQAWVDRWQELRKDLFTDETYSEIIVDLSSQISESQQRNFDRWPGVSPNGGPYADSGLARWEGELSHVKGWLSARLHWTDTLLVEPPTFNRQNVVVPAGFGVTLTASSGEIYYTMDGSDPRAPGGEPSAQAILYTGEPIEINDTAGVRMVARVRKGTAGGTYNLQQWSGPETAEFAIFNGLVFNEIQYNPHEGNASPGDVEIDSDAFEFVELANIGNEAIDLAGLQFARVDVAGDRQGIAFVFSAQMLHPGEHIVVVNDRDAFVSRYGNAPRIAQGDDGKGGKSGEYDGQLSNAGEMITLRLPSGITIASFDYGDAGNWPERADGQGSSLEPIDPQGDLDDPRNWRASVGYGGTPGLPNIDPVESVVINEVLTNTEGAAEDLIEFFNPTDTPVDMGGFWLSDTLDELERYVFPANTVVPARGYLVFQQSDFGFGLSGNGEEVVLVQPAHFTGSQLFVDHVSFGAAFAGESFGRWPDVNGGLYPMLSATPGTSNSGPRNGSVVISEFMYHPSAAVNIYDTDLLEFIELYNLSHVAMDLTHWTLDGVGYEFPEATTIGPGQNLVLVPFDPLSSSVRGAFVNEYEVDIPEDGAGFLGPYPGRANNSGETLTLRRPIDPADPTVLGIEDQVIYDDLPPWPTSADGTGKSLRRVMVDFWGNDVNSWEAGTPSPGRMKRTIEVVTDNEPMVIGEVGRIEGLTHEATTINLAHNYTNPIVFAQPPSYNGIDPTLVRVKDVQADQFTVYLAEPSNLNGLHNVGESVSYLVIESGTHWLSDRRPIDVGVVETSALVGINVESPSFATVAFGTLFNTLPVVLTHVQTNAGEAFLSTRQHPAENSSFRVALEGEELFGGPAAKESVGYLAMERQSGVWNGLPFRAATSFQYTEIFRSMHYATHFDTIPNVMASLASYNGTDNSHLRFQDMGLKLVEVMVEEDTTVDDEIGHTLEEVTFLAIGGAGLLNAMGRPLLDGQTAIFQHEVTHTGLAADVNVTLNLTHSHVADLEIVLMAPDGTVVELLSNVGGVGQDIKETILDDEAPGSITSALAPFQGTFQPEGSLRDFGGAEINGTWTLTVTDNSENRHTGVPVDWIMDIELTPSPHRNLNYDSRVGAGDIDILFSQFGSADATYDLNSDGAVDQEDVDYLVRDIMGRRYGDVDLDGMIDSEDLNAMIVNYDPAGLAAFNGWNDGNSDGDADIDITDFLNGVRNFSPSGDMALTVDDNDTLAVLGLVDRSGTLDEGLSLQPPATDDDVQRGARRIQQSSQQQAILEDDLKFRSIKRANRVDLPDSDSTPQDQQL